MPRFFIWGCKVIVKWVFIAHIAAYLISCLIAHSVTCVNMVLDWSSGPLVWSLLKFLLDPFGLINGYFNPVESGEPILDGNEGGNDIGVGPVTLHNPPPSFHTYPGDDFENTHSILRVTGRLVRDAMLHPLVRSHLLEYLAPGSLVLAGGLMLTHRIRQLPIG